MTLPSDSVTHISPSPGPTSALGSQSAASRKSRAAVSKREGVRSDSSVKETDRATESPSSDRPLASLRRKRRSSSDLLEDLPTREGSRDSRHRARPSKRADRPLEEHDTAAFLPKLGKIPEGKEASPRTVAASRGSKASNTAISSQHRREQSKSDRVALGRPRYISKKYTTTARRPFTNTNASLVSILSTLTGISDGSNSTITQKSYNRHYDPGITPSRSRETPAAHSGSHSAIISESSRNMSRAHNYRASVVDAEDLDIVHEHEDTCSSGSSEDSDHESSESPTTPSSKSSFPSPMTTRGSSRSKPPQRRGSVASSVSEHPSYATSDEYALDRGRRHSSTVSTEVHDRHGEDNHSDRYANEYNRRLAQEEALHEHIHATSDPMNVYADSQQHAGVYGQRMIQETSHTPHEPHIHHPVAYSAITNATMSPAPDAPDLRKTTLTGYEQVATALSDPESSVRPMYRKFEHLNHRVLLHLQEEITELEEQLRRVDEWIAQTTHATEDGRPMPASRRQDNYYGTDAHYRRRDILGYIFVKTEQYNRAVASYASLNSSNVAPPTTTDIDAYKTFMKAEKPIHEHETRFLDHATDLVTFPAQRASTNLSHHKIQTLLVAVGYILIPLLITALISNIPLRILLIGATDVSQAVLQSGTSVYPGPPLFSGNKIWPFTVL